MLKLVILLIGAVALVAGQDLLESVPRTCSAINDGLDWNNKTLFGTWLELARNPIGNTKACVEFTVGLLADGKTLSINASHSSSSSSLHQNVNETANVTLVANQKTGYNVTFYQGSRVEAPVVINLLKVINETYIIGCGYTNATDNSTSYGFILGRPNQYNATGIKKVNDLAFPLYSNFKNNTYGNITQMGCHKNSAAQSLPLLSGFVALALLLIKAQ